MSVVKICVELERGVRKTTHNRLLLLFIWAFKMFANKVEQHSVIRFLVSEGVGFYEMHR